MHLAMAENKIIHDGILMLKHLPHYLIDRLSQEAKMNRSLRQDPG